MVTDRPTVSLLRACRTPAGLLRFSWLAALLLGLLYTHGISGETPAGHMTAGTAMTATASSHEAHPVGGGTTSESGGEHQESAPAHDGDETGHAAEGCLSGQPQQGADLPAPCTTPMGVVPLPPAQSWALRSPAESAKASSPPQRDPALLRI